MHGFDGLRGGGGAVEGKRIMFDVLAIGIVGVLDEEAIPP